MGSPCVGEPGGGVALERAFSTRRLLLPWLLTSSRATPPGSEPITRTRNGDATKTHLFGFATPTTREISSESDLCEAFWNQTMKYSVGGVVSLSLGVSGARGRANESAHIGIRRFRDPRARLRPSVDPALLRQAVLD